MIVKTAFRGIVEDQEEQYQPTTLFIQSISTLGKVVVVFSEKMIVPANITRIDQDVIRLELITAQELDNEASLDFAWNVTSYTDTQMSL